MMRVCRFIGLCATCAVAGVIMVVVAAWCGIPELWREAADDARGEK